MRLRMSLRYADLDDPRGKLRINPKCGLSVNLTPVMIALALLWGVGCAAREPAQPEETKNLSHDETLQWIQKNQAWRRARKTKPLWARAVDNGEIGKEFQTADHALERAKEGYWLCVGTAGEPWFQKPERLEAKYDPAGDEKKQFSFDSAPRDYRIYKPKETLRNWVAQVKGPGIAGFYIKPNYDMDHPLYSPAGGYVVTNDTPDPYQGKIGDVWLVQEAIFDSTYELLP
jgi:hypothetical protein